MTPKRGPPTKVLRVWAEDAVILSNLGTTWNLKTFAEAFHKLIKERNESQPSITRAPEQKSVTMASESAKLEERNLDA